MIIKNIVKIVRIVKIVKIVKKVKKIVTMNMEILIMMVLKKIVIAIKKKML